MATAQRKTVGRPRAREPKSERLPPIYVSAKFAAAAKERAEQENMDWAEFGRTALEYYIANEGKPQEVAPVTTPDNQLTLTIEPTYLEKLRKLARPHGYRLLEHFAEDLLLNALNRTPRQIQDFLLGDFLKVGEEGEQKERERLLALRDQRKTGNGKAA